MKELTLEECNLIFGSLMESKKELNQALKKLSGTEEQKKMNSKKIFILEYKVKSIETILDKLGY